MALSFRLLAVAEAVEYKGTKRFGAADAKYNRQKTELSYGACRWVKWVVLLMVRWG